MTRFSTGSNHRRDSIVHGAWIDPAEALPMHDTPNSTNHHPLRCLAVVDTATPQAPKRASVQFVHFYPAVQRWTLAVVVISPNGDEEVCETEVKVLRWQRDITYLY